MKNNNEALKKHHFWILAGAVPLFVLLALIFMMTGVGAAISKEKAAIKKSQDDVKAAKPPGKGVLNGLEEQTKLLQKKKGELWKENWDRQKEYFTWPPTSRGEFDKYAGLKFGDNLKETSNEFEVFKGTYLGLFRDMAATIRPTQFAGGSWQSVLRYVRDWGTLTPRSEQIWLALEDVWVERALLKPIQVVNESTATFTPLADPQSAPLKRKFRSRVWDLTLEVADQGPSKVLKGKLKNRTGQLQMLGVNNTMRLNVWFETLPNAPYFPLEVQGEFVPGDTEVDIPQVPTNTLPPGVAPTDIVRVEQVLDSRTVPIRRLDRMALGYPSSKHATQELKAPAFWKEEAPAGGTGDGSPGGMPPGMGGPPPGMGGGPVSAGLGGPGGKMGGMSVGGPPGMGGGAAAGAGPAGVLDANRRRYLETTDQVRRMPVALVLVVDQMFIPDVLVAYANSPFRFHAVQYHWRRFHGTIPVNTGTPTGAPGGSGPFGGPYGGPFGGPGGPGGDSDANGPSVGGLIGNGLAGSPPPGGGVGKFGMGGPPPGYGGFGGGYGMFGGGGSSGIVSEAQANAGLVELTIYGIISLYEKYDPSKDPTAADTAKAEPTP